MSTRILPAFAVLIFAAPLLGRAEEGKLMIYPAKGQSAQQLADDRYACYKQAVQQSGFDPANPPAAISTSPVAVEVPENPNKGAAGKGTVAGAIAGAAVGSRDRDAVGGAIVGAIVGQAVGGAVEAKGEAKAREQARTEAKQKAAARAEQRADLERRRAAYRASMQACLEARGYTVR
jgi:outer membrane lipoprotein SlyB